MLRLSLTLLLFLNSLRSTLTCGLDPALQLGNSQLPSAFLVLYIRIGSRGKNFGMRDGRGKEKPSLLHVYTNVVFLPRSRFSPRFARSRRNFLAVGLLPSRRNLVSLARTPSRSLSLADTTPNILDVEKETLKAGAEERRGKGPSTNHR